MGIHKRSKCGTHLHRRERDFPTTHGNVLSGVDGLPQAVVPMGTTASPLVNEGAKGGFAASTVPVAFP